jgi:hypothetical protein
MGPPHKKQKIGPDPKFRTDPRGAILGLKTQISFTKHIEGVYHLRYRTPSTYFVPLTQI